MIGSNHSVKDRQKIVTKIVEMQLGIVKGL